MSWVNRIHVVPSTNSALLRDANAPMGSEPSLSSFESGWRIVPRRSTLRHRVLLVVDNRDSFTFNLAEVFAALGAEVRVERATALDVATVLALGPTRVVIGPGPGTPADAQPSEELIRALPRHGIPVLGVCLGHQAIGTAFGGRVVQAPALVHGETRLVHHDGCGVYEGLPLPLALARYNSLIVDETSLAEALRSGELEISAREEDGTIAGLRHTTFPLEGVQGHPESILCVDGGGRELLRNFLEHGLARESSGRRRPARPRT
jgi:anthranilate synthase/aminodeoxychorismate synthase-like glutamine amidotransferase